MTPITTYSQRHLERIEAIRNSLTMLSKNRTPSRAPTVATEAGVKRSAIHSMMSHAMPVSRKIHQGSASRHSAIAPQHASAALVDEPRRSIPPICAAGSRKDLTAQQSADHPFRLYLDSVSVLLCFGYTAVVEVLVTMEHRVTALTLSAAARNADLGARVCSSAR
jgi:hypothetical protein